MSADPTSAEPSSDLKRLASCLQQARLRQGLSLEDLADRLHMGREQLKSLESADPSGLPEPVFVIAQARRVASALGVSIDPEIQALRTSLQGRKPGPLLAETASSPAQPQPTLPRRGRGPAPRGPRPRWPLPLAAAGLLAALAAAGFATYQKLVRPAGGTGGSSAQAPAAPAPAAPPAALVGDPPPALGAPRDSEAGESRLLLRAQQPSWLEVRDAGGTTLFRGTLQGEQSFPLKTELQVLAGRPDLVEVERPGQPKRLLGRIDQVSWQRFRAPAP